MQPASSRRRFAYGRLALVLALAAAGVLTPTASAAEALTEDGFRATIDVVPMTAARSCVVGGACTTVSGPWSGVGWDQAGKRSVTVLDSRYLPGSLVNGAIVRATLVLQQGTTTYRATPSAPPSIIGENGLQVGGIRTPGSADGPLGPLRDAPLGAFPDALTPGPVGVDVTDEIRAWVLHMRDTASGRPGGALGVASLGHPRSGDELTATIATPAHPDADAQPVLHVASVDPAQAGSEVGGLAAGETTERFVPLSARAGSRNVVQARFEYRIGGTEEWRRIPLDALRDWTTGKRLSSEIVPVASEGSSQRLTWDLDATPGTDANGPIDVRALLGTGSSAGGGGVTPIRRFLLQRPVVVTPGGGTGNGNGETPPPVTPPAEQPAGSHVPLLVTPLPGVVGPSAARPAGSPAARIGSSRASATRSGRITVAVRCPSGTVGCRGFVTATLPGSRSSHATVVARTRYRAAPGTTASVRLQLGPKGRRALARGRGGRLSLRLTASAADGTVGPARRVVVRSAR